MLTGAHVQSKHLGRGVEEEVGYRTTAGIAAPLVDLRVVDENMADVPHDGKSFGEIVVRTPWLTMGYLNDRGGFRAALGLAAICIPATSPQSTRTVTSGFPIA